MCTQASQLPRNLRNRLPDGFPADQQVDGALLAQHPELLKQARFVCQ